MRVEVAADAAGAARVAAGMIEGAVREAVAARGSAAVAMSGGETPARMLRLLAATKLPWRDVHIFQVDERIVAPDDPRRNLRGLIEALDGSGASAAQIHAMAVSEPDPARAARAYMDTLRSTLGPEMRLDIVHLGLGADGHTASLVPGDPALDSTDDVAITAPYRGTRRMTLTLPVINRARARLWLVTGESKRSVFERLVAGDAELIATHVKRELALVVADAAAAGRERGR